MYAQGVLQQSAYLDKQTHAAIIDGSEQVYTNLAAMFRPSREVIHRVGLCVVASDLLREKLQEKGIKTVQARATGWIYHVYLALNSEVSDERILIDPTWQQFLDKELITPDTPKVLIGRIDEVTARARHHGFDEVSLGIYPPV